VSILTREKHTTIAFIKAGMKVYTTAHTSSQDSAQSKHKIIPESQTTASTHGAMKDILNTDLGMLCHSCKSMLV